MNIFNEQKSLLRGKQLKDSSPKVYIIAKGIEKWLGTVKYMLLYVFA